MIVRNCSRGILEVWVLAFLPLGVWVWLQARRIDGLARRVAELELQLFALRTRSSTPAPTASETTGSEASPQDELVLTEVVPDDVLILDNPLPEASNDIGPEPQPEVEAAPPPAQAPLLLDQPIAESPQAKPRHTAPPPPAQKRPPPRLDQWLAERGLAWVAGIALALGVIFLVSFAIQSSWFTPAVRLACAAVAGLTALGASEWMRRQGLRKAPGHPLLSALFAGAGMVALYATTWAAYGPFDFINLPIAAALLVLCATALIGLSFLHGEAIGVLAIGLALLAPALTNAPLWPSTGLIVYLGLVSAGGFALAIFKRWAWVSITAIGGLYFWYFAAIVVDDIRQALAVISFASIGGVLTALRAPVGCNAKKRVTWANVAGLGPSLAISVSSALLIWAWLAVASAPFGRIAGPALIGIFHVALAAFAVNERKAAPAALAIATGGLVLGFVAFLRARGVYAPLGGDFYPTILLAAFGVTACALFANPRHRERALIAGSGAMGSALLILLAASSRDNWHALAAWMPLFVGAAVLFGAAWRTEQSAADRTTDAAIAWWAGGGAVLTLIGIESLFSPEFRTLGHAGAALLFSAGLVWRGWRIAGWAALSAAALAIGQALSPSLIGAILSGQQALWIGLTTLAAAAALLFGASTIVRRGNTNLAVAEALSAAAVIVVLIGLFVALRWFAGGGAGVTLDAFTETSLRVLALMAAGLILLPRGHENPGPIGAWRGHVLLGLGLLYALLVPGLGLNPWWGGPGRAVIGGLPALNALAIAFAAPAACAFMAANLLYTRERALARLYTAAGAALALLWLTLEIRRAFHGAAMASPDIGLFEAACYALALLAFALAAALTAKVRAQLDPHRPFTEDLSRSVRALSWGALSIAGLIMLVVQHPIWGGHDSTESNALSTMLAVLAQFAATILALLLGRALSRSREVEPARFAAAAAASLFAWSFGHCVIRWLHHRGYMDDGAPLLNLEGLMHAVWPLAFVSGAALLTRLAPGRDTVRAYLYDLQSIWSAAIWPALGFAALGLAFLFAPWWGAWPAAIPSTATAVLALTLYGAAAALSYTAPDTPAARGLRWLAPSATALCVMHVFVLLTLAARWFQHGAGMNTEAAGEVELWVYSVLWALLGAATLALGTVRNDAVLRWAGLAAFAVTIIKVFVIDTAQLSPLARAASFVGLALIAAVSAWLARRNRQPPSPGDLITVTPSARRERRRIRRRKPH